MVAARVGSITSGSATTADVEVTLPQAATAGNLLLVAIGASRTTTGEQTPTAAGWTKLGSGWASNGGSASGGVTFMGKIAAGGETSVTFARTGSGAHEWAAQEWSGLDLASSFPAGPAAPATYTTNTAGSGPISPPTRVTAADDEVVFTAFGGRANAGGISPTWAAGPTVDHTQIADNNAYLYLVSQVVPAASTSVTHTVSTFTNGFGTPVNAIGSVAFASKVSTIVAVTLTAVGSISASATGARIAQATLTATGSLSATATRGVVPSAVALGAVGTISATATRNAATNATLAAVGAITTTATRATSAEASRSAVVGIDAAANTDLGVTGNALNAVGVIEAAIGIIRDIDIAVRLDPYPWSAALDPEPRYRAHAATTSGWSATLEEE